MPLLCVIVPCTCARRADFRLLGTRDRLPDLTTDCGPSSGAGLTLGRSFFSSSPTVWVFMCSTRKFFSSGFLCTWPALLALGVRWQCAVLRCDARFLSVSCTDLPSAPLQRRGIFKPPTCSCQPLTRLWLARGSAHREPAVCATRVGVPPVLLPQRRTCRPGATTSRLLCRRPALACSRRS